MKVKLNYYEVVDICNSVKKLSFIRGDDAMTFYRDKLKMQDAFRAEDQRIEDLSLQALDIQGDKKWDDLTQEQVSEIDRVQAEIRQLKRTEKELDVTPIPFEKFKEGEADDIDTIQIFGKLIKV